MRHGPHEEEVIATLSTGRDDSAIEVVVERGPQSEPVVELREIRWTEGIGSYTVRRLAIDPDAAIDVRDALTQAAFQARSESEPNSEAGSQVVCLPLGKTRRGAPTSRGAGELHARRRRSGASPESA